MNAVRLSPLPSHPGDYRFAWAVSFLIALASAPFVVLFKDRLPWLVVVPIAIGMAIIVTAEFVAAFGSGDKTEGLITIPTGYTGTFSYDSLLALEIQPKKKIPKEQLSLFPSFQEPTSRSSIRKVIDEHGNEVSVVSCDRFSALLVSYLLENMDKATESSLRAGLARFGKLGRGQSDIQIFVHDKAIREAIKADFRGNLLTLVSKGGEKVVKDLLKTLEAAEEARQTVQK